MTLFDEIGYPDGMLFKHNDNSLVNDSYQLCRISINNKLEFIKNKEYKIYVKGFFKSGDFITTSIYPGLGFKYYKPPENKENYITNITNPKPFAIALEDKNYYEDGLLKIRTI